MAGNGRSWAIGKRVARRAGTRSKLLPTSSLARRTKYLVQRQGAGLLDLYQKPNISNFEWEGNTTHVVFVLRMTCEVLRAREVRLRPLPAGQESSEADTQSDSR